ncbi:MAG: hypothetical protein IJ459_06155 [Clostridia bacterium]|nr:hypothetical protein [Clostridia bacterium]
MEQIYTIPVNEAFDLVSEKKECGCPFCVLYRKLQEDELDIILGASMMEPDIRIKTNEQGFCLTHYNMMLGRKRMLGMGLILESHLDEVKKKLSGPVVLGNKRAAAISALGTLESDCYVCSRIEKNLNAMTATAVYLWDSDCAFREKFEKVPYFCLPHYRAMVDYASKKMSKRSFSEFYDAAYGIEERYLSELRLDVSWFCKKFDYRYDEEPWYNSKDSVQRTIKFLSGDPKGE